MTASTKSKVPKRIAGEIRAFCEVHADLGRVQKYSRYFVEGYDSFGVDHKLPEWETRRTEWLAQLTTAGLPALLDACDLLVRPGKYEEVVTAIRFVADSSALYSPEVFARIGKWFEQGIANWAEVDVMCSLVLGHFLNRGVVGVTAFQPWVASPFKYQRRAVPVTLIELLKATEDFPVVWRAIEPLVEPLMSDNEKVVQQGMGWFLREVWKRQPQLAETFLLRHKDTCPRLIVQYATEKMDSAGKLRFKRSR